MTDQMKYGMTMGDIRVLLSRPRCSLISRMPLGMPYWQINLRCRWRGMARAYMCGNACPGMKIITGSVTRPGG